MVDLSALLQQGAMNPFLFIPSAILLGALHGLEPGHSKTMMAAFIIAIRGTVSQAIMLGLAATLSHTAVVWAVALGGMKLGSHWNAETTEPYFQMASAALILGVAFWMLARTWREQQREKIEAVHSHGHDHHDHGEEVRRIDTGHGAIAELSIMEDGVPPRFWLAFEKNGKPIPPPSGEICTVETTRPDGSHKGFTLVSRGAYLESVDEVPEPHEFTVRLKMAHGDHVHDYDVVFTEHDHDHHTHAGLDVSAVGFQDAHEQAHADDIRRRFADRNVTTGQIIVFGLTGGLIPCPAAITILILCLQLKRFSLGVGLVLCFSIGLALTMVTSGVIAALSVRYASRQWSGFGSLARRAPYFSSGLIILLGLYMGYQGLTGLR